MTYGTLAAQGPGCMPGRPVPETDAYSRIVCFGQLLYPPDHGGETLRACRREVAEQSRLSERPEPGGSNLSRRPLVEDTEKKSDQAADDHRIAVRPHPEPPVSQLRPNPDSRLAAGHGVPVGPKPVRNPEPAAQSHKMRVL